jgi:hypothetical protein
MATEHNLGKNFPCGRVARGVLAGALMAVAGMATPLFARPPVQQAPRPRMETNQPHLGTWLQRHSNLTPEEQEKALQREPGFNRLTPETQQKLLDRLRQLNRMPPTQRARTMDHIEAMESLSPQMRQQVNASVQQFRMLSPERQRLMKKAYRDLRAYPPEQRAAMMNSSQFQAQFSPQERYIMGNLLSVEPYRPNHGSLPGDDLQYGH